MDPGLLTSAKVPIWMDFQIPSARLQQVHPVWALESLGPPLPHRAPTPSPPSPPTRPAPTTGPAPSPRPAPVSATPPPEALARPGAGGAPGSSARGCAALGSRGPRAALLRMDPAERAQAARARVPR